MQEKGRKKNQEKRIILAFLREEAGILLWVVFFIGIFWLLCFLEDILVFFFFHDNKPSFLL